MCLFSQLHHCLKTFWVFHQIPVKQRGDTWILSKYPVLKKAMQMQIIFLKKMQIKGLGIELNFGPC